MVPPEKLSVVSKTREIDRYKHLLTHQKPITASSCSERYTACYCGDAVWRKRRGGCRVAARTAPPPPACPGAEPGSKSIRLSRPALAGQTRGCVPGSCSCPSTALRD